MSDQSYVEAQHTENDDKSKNNESEIQTISMIEKEDVETETQNTESNDPNQKGSQGIINTLRIKEHTNVEAENANSDDECRKSNEDKVITSKEIGNTNAEAQNTDPDDTSDKYREDNINTTPTNGNAKDKTQKTKSNDTSRTSNEDKVITSKEMGNTNAEAQNTDPNDASIKDNADVESTTPTNGNVNAQNAQNQKTKSNDTSQNGSVDIIPTPLMKVNANPKTQNTDSDDTSKKDSKDVINTSPTNGNHYVTTQKTKFNDTCQTGGDDVITTPPMKWNGNPETQNTNSDDTSKKDGKDVINTTPTHGNANAITKKTKSNKTSQNNSDYVIPTPQMEVNANPDTPDSDDTSNKDSEVGSNATQTNGNANVETQNTNGTCQESNEHKILTPQVTRNVEDESSVLTRRKSDNCQLDLEFSSDHLALQWKGEENPSDEYIIKYRPFGKKLFKHKETNVRICHLKNLKNETKYEVKIYKIVDGNSIFEIADTFLTQPSVALQLKDKIGKAEKVKDNPTIFKLVLFETTPRGGMPVSNEGDDAIGSLQNDEKSILLLGAIGSGKSTLVNAMINYILGVTVGDDFRFQVSSEQAQECHETQMASTTTKINWYRIQKVDGLKTKYPVRICDTPGFGDQSQGEHNQNLHKQLEELHKCYDFKNFDRICIVTPSAARLTDDTKHIFDSIMPWLSREKTEVVPFTTFYSGGHAQVLDILRKLGIQFRNEFRINNSNLFCATALGTYWSACQSTFDAFFDTLGNCSGISIETENSLLSKNSHNAIIKDSPKKDTESYWANAVHFNTCTLY